MTSKRIIVTTENTERTFDADSFTYDANDGTLEVHQGDGEQTVMIAIFAATKWESAHFAEDETDSDTRKLKEIGNLLNKHFPEMDAADLITEHLAALAVLRELDPGHWAS